MSEHKPVEFNDVYCLTSEKEEQKNDNKKIAKECLKNRQSWLCNQLSEVIKKTKELYELVVEASTFELSCESEFHGED